MRKPAETAPGEGLLIRPAYALGRLHNELTGRLERELGTIGLSLRTHQVLACVAEHRAHSQQEVSETVEVDRSEMVRIIDRLEEAGLLMREPDPADRRRHRLRLTATGHGALRRGEEIVQSVTDEVLASLTVEDRRALHALTVRALGGEGSRRS